MKKKTETKIIILTAIIVLPIAIFSNAYTAPIEKEQFKKYQTEEEILSKKEMVGMFLEIEAEKDKIIEEARIRAIAKQPKTASWYDYDIKGIKWSKDHNTCASRTLIRYSHALVTNLDNGKSVKVYVNDFGPEAWTDIDIDLSSHAFSQIANLSDGLANVKIEQL